MEEKRLKQFTFYDLYYEALKGLPDEAAGRMAKNICRFMFTNEEIPEPQDDKENFFWSNIKDVLEEVKRIEESGRKPKNLNEKMPHFMFIVPRLLLFGLTVSLFIVFEKFQQFIMLRNNPH